MRVAWTTRRRETSTGEWVDANTSFVRVTCWRRLADNLATCLRKGDPVLLRGRLDVRSFVGKDGQRRTSVEVDANTLGHDLSRGVAGFRRVWEKTGRTAEEIAAEASGDGPAGEDEAIAAGDLVPAGDADLVPHGEGELVAAGPGPADEDAFDDGAAEALARDAGSVTTVS
jgi:single-strand DNA-binding protein